jgi:HK97 family phage major capsid protein
MAKNGQAADTTTAGSGKKTGERVKRLLDVTEKTMTLLEKLNASPGAGSGGKPTPAQIFAEVKDRKIESQGGFKHEREFLLAVMNHGQGKKMDPRLEKFFIKTAGSDENQSQSLPYGGFLIPYGFIPDVLKIEPEQDPMGSLTRKVPMAQPAIKIPARTDKNHQTSVSGGLIVTRKAETDTAAPSRMQLEQVSLESHSLFGLAYASEELLSDSPVSFVALLQSGFADQFTYQLIDERLNGTGVGQYLGIMNSPCLVTVAVQPGQATKTIVYENILNMRARSWGYGKSIWIANHDCVPQLMLLNQAVGTGGAVVWQPSAREDHPDTLLGRPLIFSEYAQTLGTTGDIVLGNWNEYLEGLYQPMMQEESIHVRFLNHERTFKFWVRNAGTPWWRVPLTTKRSANTLSPFVVLASR